MGRRATFLGFAVMSGLSSTADIRLRYIEDATGHERHSALSPIKRGEIVAL